MAVLITAKLLFRSGAIAVLVSASTVFVGAIVVLVSAFAVLWVLLFCSVFLL